MNDQLQIVQSINKVNKILKIIDHPNPKQLKIDNAEIYPNNLICCIKFKIFLKDRIQSIYGTGCLVNQNYVLTAAHNIQRVLMLYNDLQNTECKIQGYVKQGLHDGKYVNKYRINLERMKISQNYLSNFVNTQFFLPLVQGKLNSRDYDYALFQITHLEGEKHQQDRFPPIVAIKEKQYSLIGQVSLYGFAYEVNKNIYKTQANTSRPSSSIFMQSMFGGTDIISQFTAKNLKYEIPTDKGVSGGPIIVSISQPAIVGIHKCMIQNMETKTAINAGVSTLLMMEQLNDWGHELIKKPFVFTKSTLALRSSSKIGKNDIFSLIDNNLDYLDMHVINGYDLSAVKKIILSGNKIEEEGVRILLRREYPSLQSLFLSENEINSLSKVSKEGWSHIKSVKNLSLSVNHLSDLPEGILQLIHLQKFHLTYNAFISIPKILFDFNNQKVISVPIYENNFKANEQTEIKAALLAKSIHLLLHKYQK